MKKVLAVLAALSLGFGTAMAVDDNTVEIVYNGTSATVTVASNIESYVSNVSNGAHVKLVQSDQVNDKVGEIIYILSGTSSDGEFYLEGSYKCGLELRGLTLTNPSGPAINIQNGKRVEVSVKKGYSNSIADGANDDYNGCFHCKGHTEFKGAGTLTVVGNSKHAIYSKEYIEVKKCVINITDAAKDAIHCQEYFYMESGTINITGAADDGIQVELRGDKSTGITAGHEDEDTGNFYMEDGTLTIKGYGGKAIKVDGTISYMGGKQDFDTTDTTVATGVNAARGGAVSGGAAVYTLDGRKVAQPGSGLYIIRDGKEVKKIKK